MYLLLASLNLMAQNTDVPQQYKNFAKKIDSTLNIKNSDFFSNSWDKAAFTKRIKNNITTQLSQQQLIELGTATGNICEQLTTKIISNLGDDGFYENISIKINDKGEVHATFRMIVQSGAINYHDMFLHETEGKVKIVDIHAFSLGEYFSQTMGRLFTLSLGGGKIQQNWMSFSRAKVLITQGHVKEGYKAFMTIPESFRNRKTILFAFLQATMQQEKFDDKSDGIYLKALEMFHKTYPNDPSMLLIHIDYYYLRKEYVKGLENINQLQKIVNNDPYLNIFKALIHKELKQYDKLIELIEPLIAANKYLDTVYSLALEGYYGKGNYKKLLEKLVEFSTIVGVSLKDIATTNLYPEFFKSKIWEDWQTRQNTKD